MRAAHLGRLHPIGLHLHKAKPDTGGRPGRPGGEQGLWGWGSRAAECFVTLQWGVQASTRLFRPTGQTTASATQTHATDSGR